MNKLVSSVIVSLFISAVAFALPPKNVILFIGDGMSTPQRMVGEEFSKIQRGKILRMNHLEYQATTRTCSSSSLITDSAAAATAIACGVKTYNGAIGVDAERNRVEPVSEFAAKTGRKVGIVTSVQLNHATPAGFYGHRASRGNGYGLALDLVDSGFDYFAGGELMGANNKKDSEYKGSAYDLAAKAGYTVIKRDAAKFRALKPGASKVLFIAGETLPFAIDADENPDVPTLAELTAKGIELLDNEKGFFMMVEGGMVDWAGHANDAASNLGEVLALDEAVSVALDFAKKDTQTLVIVTGDHETGGMTMGFAGTGYKMNLESLALQKCSAGRLDKLIAAAKPETFEDVKPILEENLSFSFGGGAKNGALQITPAELKILTEAFESGRKKRRYGALVTAVKNIFSHKCGVGWTTGAHTALPVLTSAVGPGADKFIGFIDNTDISKKIKELLK